MITRLGVNIDHIATIRNARGEKHPDPYKIAKFAMRNGADSITVHLREDRRHIKDNDLKILTSNKFIPINLEMAANLEMLKIAIKHKPRYVCIVPEKRKEITTEGGLNLNNNNKILKRIINSLNKKKIRTSLFINPTIKSIKTSKIMKSKCVELHTGKLSNLVKNKKNYTNELKKIINCAKYAKSIGLEVHVGHGLDYKTTKLLSRSKYIEEFNIGHFIIGEAVLDGLKKVINKFRGIIK